MRISELSRQANLPVATIKYYLREGLVHPGEATAVTQAEYDESHVQRLRLVRALADPGGLSLSAIRRVLAALDDEDMDIHTVLGTACYALGPALDERAAEDSEWAAVRADVDALLADMRWEVTQVAPARDQLAHALLALRELGTPCPGDHLRAYARAAQSLAREEIGWLSDAPTRTQAVETAVTAMVLYEPVLLALRRLAEEHESARHYRDPSARGRSEAWDSREEASR